MADIEVQNQINEINRKLDLVLFYVNEQRLKSEVVEDLVSDVSIIGKDAFDTAVEELDRQGIEIDVDQVKLLVFKVIRNIGNFSQLMDTFESVTDLMKDVGPIANEVMIDSVKKLYEFEKKGYFEFFKELFKVLDNIVTNYSVEDVRLLSDNIVTIMDTMKNLTQPDMLKAMNNALNIYKSLDMEDVKEYSLWKAFREMNTPEMKKSIGFMMTFMKNLTKESLSESNK